MEWLRKGFQSGEGTVVAGNEVLHSPLKIIVISIKRPSPYFSDVLLWISCPVCGDIKQQFMTAPPILGIEWALWLLLGVAHAVAVRCRLGLESSEGSAEWDIQDGACSGRRLMLAGI